MSDAKAELRPLGILPSGRVVWPMAGGADDSEDKPPADGDGPGDGDKPLDWEAEASKWKAMARKHEGEAKRNAAAARRLAESEEADKSDTEKLVQRAEQAERRATDAELRALRMEVAGERGLTHKMASRLVGATREELEADAVELLKELRPATGAGARPGDTPGGRPRETLQSGTTPESQPEENDPDKLAAMVPRS